ncbi:MAG: SDR family NAD(P)-dependent oxidoreductase [Thermodesulfobacteriota bacterium]
MSWQINLSGKSGIVTGAASGIGKSVAMHLAGMGASLTLVDINDEGLSETVKNIQNTVGTPALSIKTDVSDEDQVCQATSGCLRRFNAIDFLVNSHGILRRTRFLDIQTAEWDLMIGVNLRSCFILCKAVLPYMKQQSGGSIVNVSSLAGRSCSILGGAHYTTAKHGLIGLSRHLAREFAPFGIRVNAFCPGATLTPMIINSTPREEIERIAAAIPRGCWATPEEQAGTIGFLVSDFAVNITGACIDSNGGGLMI